MAEGLAPRKEPFHEKIRKFVDLGRGEHPGGPVGAFGELDSYLDSEDPNEKKLAVQTLGELGVNSPNVRKMVVDRLVELMGSLGALEGDVRDNAVLSDAFSEIGNALSTSPGEFDALLGSLKTKLADENPAVWHTAASALIKLGVKVNDPGLRMDISTSVGRRLDDLEESLKTGDIPPGALNALEEMRNWLGALSVSRELPRRSPGLAGKIKKFFGFLRRS